MKNKNQLTTDAQLVLKKLANVLRKMSSEQYSTPLSIFDENTFGSHTRHIIELFQALMDGYNSAMVIYDNRKRDPRIHSDRDFALECIEELINEIDKEDKTMHLKTVHLGDAELVETNYNRELLYNIEHCIHHQAILRIGLNYLNINIDDDDFGYAKSTLKYRSQCAQ